MKKKNFDFDDKKIEVTIIGYGEKRNKRVNVALEKTIFSKATFKAQKMGLSLNECINQLLYHWSKDVTTKDLQLSLFDDEGGKNE